MNRRDFIKAFSDKAQKSERSSRRAAELKYQADKDMLTAPRDDGMPLLPALW